MNKVLMYSSAYCPFCHRAAQLLSAKGADVDVRSVDGDPATHQEMMHRAGRTSVPQIFIGDQHIGGCDELYALERRSELDALLAPA